MLGMGHGPCWATTPRATGVSPVQPHNHHTSAATQHWQDASATQPGTLNYLGNSVLTCFAATTRTGPMRPDSWSGASFQGSSQVRAFFMLVLQ